MIVAAILAKNEAAPGRYLRRVLTNCASLCDAIIVLDDGSTDDTAAVAAEHGATVIHRSYQEPAAALVKDSAQTVLSDPSWFGIGERFARAQLWDAAVELAGPDGWVYVADADHELLGCNRGDLRQLCEAQHVTCWAFVLWDCWDSDAQHRVDGYWQAWRSPRPWLFRANPVPGFVPAWPEREIHVGHCPANYPIHAGIAPPLAGIRHLSYLDPATRISKRDRYLLLGDRLTEPERLHAESITDPNPSLEPIPPAKRDRVLAASIVRKPQVVTDAFRQTLAWQRLRSATLDVALLPNYAEGETVPPLGAPEGFEGSWGILDAVAAPLGDYGDTGQTRAWTPSAFGRVAALKDQVLQYARAHSYDYVWLVDSDVLCDPFALQSLLDSCESERQIVAGVYWTQWQRQRQNVMQVQHAGPQVWLVHPYGLAGRGWTEPEFREALIGRQRLRVWGLGACTLIPVKALGKGLGFTKKFDLPGGPMADGEDRHFCAQATAQHCELIADAWPDIYHAYHPEEYAEIPQRLAELESRCALAGQRPRLGWDISAIIRNLEVPTAPAQFLRGRIGSLTVLPQIEEALAGMQPGQTRLLRAVFPVHWPEANLRNQTFTLHLTLCDAKPHKLSPVIDAELFQGVESGRILDQTTLTQQQCVEVANG